MVSEPIETRSASISSLLSRESRDAAPTRPRTLQQELYAEKQQSVSKVSVGVAPDGDHLMADASGS
jgi:hypothetical protein